jgi:hypothetical protein
LYKTVNPHSTGEAEDNGKKKTFTYQEKDSMNVLFYVVMLWMLVTICKANNFIFVDESGLNREYRRVYARAKRGVRVHGTRPGRKQKRSNIIGALWGKKHIAMQCYDHSPGACGTGKTWLASAFGNAACRKGLTVQSLRMNRLLASLIHARNDGTWAKLLTSLKKPDLLILDNFGLSPLDSIHCRDLLEIVDDRYGHGSILMTAQLPVSNWHPVFADPTLADAVLDRLVHNSHRIELHGPSLRHNPPQDASTKVMTAARNP